MSYFFAILLYVALAVLVIGLALKIRQYWNTPAPLKIPTTPAPVSRTGVVFRLFREVVLFESLFRASKWTWLFGWVFHAGLVLAFIRHLRFVISGESFMWPVINNSFVQLAGQYAGFLILAGLLGLLARRIFVDRVRYISAPSDYLMLVLIMVIVVSGLMMSFRITPIDIFGLFMFMDGLLTLEWRELPDSMVLMLHLGMVALLAIIFPFSKLLHAPGVFFSPSRNQVDNPRERRHIADWAKQLESE